MISSLNNDREYGIEIFGANIENNEIKLSIESTVKKVKISSYYNPLPECASIDHVMMNSRLNETVSIVACVEDLVVQERVKCTVFDYKLKDFSGSILLTAFNKLPLEKGSIWIDIH